jgi:hypothetical protein
MCGLSTWRRSASGGPRRLQGLPLYREVSERYADGSPSAPGSCAGQDDFQKSDHRSTDGVLLAEAKSHLFMWRAARYFDLEHFGELTSVELREVFDCAEYPPFL